MPANRRDEDRPAEVDEADWLESHREPDGAFERPGGPTRIGDRRGEANEADLLESAGDEGAADLPDEVPIDAPDADVLEQHQRPTGDDADDDDWR